jgi:8-hydroxy-5-deazaflavin:NADPH oxidoreductase
MNIAIIGAGNVGRALAGSFARAGHSVTLGSAHPETARAAAADVGVTAADSAAAAVAAGDIVVVAVPYPALPQLLDDLGDGLRGKIVVDATNPMRADYMGLATVGTSAAEEIQARAAGARVVKAFNTALAARQADPVVDGVEIDGFVAGDDDAAKATVLELVRSIGFKPIDAGPLEMARALEAMALLNITLQLRNSWPWQSAWKLVGPTGA